MSAYNWEDLDSSLNFHDTQQGLRFTFSERIRTEILHRLLGLNLSRYKEAISNGFHQKSKKKAVSANGATKSNPKVFQTTLFDDQVEREALVIEPRSKQGNSWGANASDQILAWLEAHKGWFPKSAILNGCGADPKDWQRAIDELINDGFVDSIGKSEEEKYKAIG